MRREAKRKRETAQVLGAIKGGKRGRRIRGTKSWTEHLYKRTRAANQVRHKAGPRPWASKLGPESALGGSAICCLDCCRRTELSWRRRGGAAGDRRMGGPRERTDDEGLVQTHGAESRRVQVRERQVREVSQGRAGRGSSMRISRSVGSNGLWLHLVSASWKAQPVRLTRKKKGGEEAHVCSLLWHFQNVAMVIDLQLLHPAESKQKPVRDSSGAVTM
ncbi:hypothetical protein CCMA1212_000171 [Trichoderma ghanense]|uniref:Uncharacterized protein n=1 Tax=Trichoderma ghanense TaxID=65468 RepID=A0ABY2HFP3_9HYPO